MKQSTKNKINLYLYPVLIGMVFFIVDNMSDVAKDASDDAKDASLKLAEIRLDKSFENRGYFDDLSVELVKRDYSTWGIEYNLKI